MMMAKNFRSKYLLGDIVKKNGVEYMVTETHPNLLRPVRLYTLQDGSKWTVRQLAEKLQTTSTCARHRLNSSTDLKRIFAPIRVGGRKKEEPNKGLLKTKNWYKDPLVKLMLKGGV